MSLPGNELRSYGLLALLSVQPAGYRAPYCVQCASNGKTVPKRSLHLLRLLRPAPLHSVERVGAAATLEACIRQVSGSNLGSGIGCPDPGISYFSSVPPSRCWDSTLPSKRFPNSSFTIVLHFEANTIWTLAAEINRKTRGISVIPHLCAERCITEQGGKVDCVFATRTGTR
jgi:hypothetical protein